MIAAVAATGSGAKAVGHLGLHHDRYVVKRYFGFKQSHKNGRGYIIRKICAHRKASFKIRLGYLGNVTFHNVVVYYFDIMVLAQRKGENGDKSFVKLYGEYIFITGCKLRIKITGISCFLATL